jgi:TolB-like protein/DNA-binding winged helix-turn-helix (wHTH) protein/Tfp pilus assembly protein PilF
MPTSTTEGMKTYGIGEIRVDPTRRRVTRGDTEIRLGNLTYELLLLLIEAAPSVVTQEEVAKRLWHGRIATPDTVRQRVKLLRNALADDPKNPRYLCVIRGRGFRLIPTVEHLPADLPRANSTRADSKRGWLLAAGIALLLAIPVSLLFWGGFGATDLTEHPYSSALASPSNRSIAVLPFQNLSPDPDDAYFVDGIHNEVLSRLFKIGDLKVISRTSVSPYSGTDKNLRQIGRELGVANILEGSVQRVGETVRINVQLIDTQTDEHLWADIYDRELSALNLLDIQGEIAASIAGILQAVLTPSEMARINSVATANTRAYNFYLIGNKHLRGTNNLTAFSDAAEAYQRAVDEDPEFALAWAGLSRAHSGVYFFVDARESRRELARQAVERAFELSPDLPEAHFAMGYFLYHVLDDYDAALKEWSIVAKGIPGDSRLYLARAYLYRRMGDLERAAADLDRAIDLDPRNIEQLAMQAGNYARLRDYARAERYADRIIEIQPDNLIGYMIKAQLPLWADGDVVALNAVLDSAPMAIPAPGIRWTTALYERDYDAALRYLDGWRLEAVDSLQTYRPKDWFYGITYKLAKMPELAEQHFLSARATIEQELEHRPEDPRVIIALADVLAHSGESDTAASLALRAISILSELKDATDVHHTHLNAVIALVAAGEHDAALRELDLYLSRPAPWSIEGLLPDPGFDLIRNDSRFVALVDKHSRF